MSDKPLPTDLELTALDPIFREHPHDRLDRLRTEDPVYLDAALGRLFLTRFEDMRAVLADRSLSRDPRKAPDTPRRRALMGDMPPEAFQPSMLSLDDPDHKRLRGLVSQAFNQRSVDAWRPRIRAIAEGLLDALADRGSFDVIAEFAAPLPIIVIAEMLGVDPGDMPQFKRWSDARAQIFNPVRSPEQTVELRAAGQGLNDYFARAIDTRRLFRARDRYTTRSLRRRPDQYAGRCRGGRGSPVRTRNCRHLQPAASRRQSHHYRPDRQWRARPTPAS
jgi:cytochrome P450